MAALTQTTPRSATWPSAAEIARTIGGGLMRILAVLGVLIVNVPVILLPFTTAVPTPVWILIGAFDIAVILTALLAGPRLHIGVKSGA